MPSKISSPSPSSPNLSEILTDKEEAKQNSQVGEILLPIDKRSNLFCTAPVLFVTLLRGRAAAFLSQSSITVSSRCGRRKRPMSSKPIYQPPEAVGTVQVDNEFILWTTGFTKTVSQWPHFNLFYSVFIQQFLKCFAQFWVFSSMWTNLQPQGCEFIYYLSG